MNLQSIQHRYGAEYAEQAVVAQWIFAMPPAEANAEVTRVLANHVRDASRFDDPRIDARPRRDESPRDRAWQKMVAGNRNQTYREDAAPTASAARARMIASNRARMEGW